MCVAKCKATEGGYQPFNRSKLIGELPVDANEAIFILIAIALGVYFIAIRPISIKMNEEANLHLKNEILQHISNNQAAIPVKNVGEAKEYCNRIEHFQKEGITNIERCSIIDNDNDGGKKVIVYFKKSTHE